ncbi:MAG: DoxX family protein [Candidatus Electrothrix sp. AX2]|nr:DoxX family protein [Candidatus Electrothrix gigas]
MKQPPLFQSFSLYRSDLPLVRRLLRWGYHSVRVLISSLFLYAGGSKLIALPSFAQNISDYGLLPEGFLFPAALLLVTAELLAALALLLDLRGGLTGITLLLLLFIAVLLYGIQLDLDVDCGCFGPGEQQPHSTHTLYQALYRDVFMFIGCLFLYWYRFVTAVTAIPLNSLAVLRRFPFCST